MDNTALETKNNSTFPVGGWHIFVAWGIIGIVLMFILPKSISSLTWVKVILMFPLSCFVLGPFVLVVSMFIEVPVYFNLIKVFPSITVDILFYGIALYIAVTSKDSTTCLMALIWAFMHFYIFRDKREDIASVHEQHLGGEQAKNKNTLYYTVDNSWSESKPPLTPCNQRRKAVEQFWVKRKATPAVKAPSSSELAQADLDEFWMKEKSDAEIGKLYEQYIGYLHEKVGCEVEYYGIEHGLNDLGRDLICRKDGHTWLIQCKNWSQSKTIHVKHIHQLYGTSVQYAAQHPDEMVHGAFFTTTRFSPEALAAAELLNIKLERYLMPNRFPIIKCKLCEGGERRYYLPTDRQYDMLKLDLSKGDCYCRTVVEAETAGFSRQ